MPPQDVAAAGLWSPEGLHVFSRQRDGIWRAIRIVFLLCAHKNGAMVGPFPPARDWWPSYTMDI